MIRYVLVNFFAQIFSIAIFPVSLNYKTIQGISFDVMWKPTIALSATAGCSLMASSMGAVPRL
jgi:hypothetical protein